MRYILAVVLVLACAGYVVSVERRLKSIAVEIRMADVNLVEGNTSLGRPQEVNWKSNGQTVKLTVYKATSGETAAEWTARLTGYIAQYQAPGQYPPEN